MFVFGGYADGKGTVILESGALYDPSTDEWRPAATEGGPPGRSRCVALWTDREVIVLSGSASGQPAGGRYDPATDRWASVASVPDDHGDASGVWTGTEGLLWGGYRYGGDPAILRSGHRYDPTADEWTEMAIDGAPSARWRHLSVWTGSEMVVIGGLDEAVAELIDGGRYDPDLDAWSDLAMPPVEPGSSAAQAMWTGSEMLVFWWTPRDAGYEVVALLYSPAEDSWRFAAEAPADSALGYPVWTGEVALIWSGLPTEERTTGYAYNPRGDSWTPLAQDGAPSWHGSFSFCAVWADGEMIVWGAYSWGGHLRSDGGRWRP
jgi:N-acetylneuraminic acid mutarotase